MIKSITKRQRAKVESMVESIMRAPADDELVAMVYEAYWAGVKSGEIDRDHAFEGEMISHLIGTKYEIKSPR